MGVPLEPEARGIVGRRNEPGHSTANRIDRPARATAQLAFRDLPCPARLAGERELAPTGRAREQGDVFDSHQRVDPSVDTATTPEAHDARAPHRASSPPTPRA